MTYVYYTEVYSVELCDICMLCRGMYHMHTHCAQHTLMVTTHVEHNKQLQHLKEQDNKAACTPYISYHASNLLSQSTITAHERLFTDAKRKLMETHFNRLEAQTTPPVC